MTTLSRAEARLWGMATVDGGIQHVTATRRDAVACAGFATPYRREKWGHVYEYIGESYGVIVGRLGDLVREGFSLPEPVCSCAACRMGLAPFLCETGKALGGPNHEAS